MSCPNSEPVRRALERAGHLLTSTATHDGKPTFGELQGSWIRSWPLAFSVTPMTSPAFTQRRRDVEHLAVHGDRAVADELRASARVDPAHPVDDVVEAAIRAGAAGSRPVDPLPRAARAK